MRATAKHTEFIRLVANGTNQSEAYRATVGNPMATLSAVKSKASNLAKKYANEIQQERERTRKVIEEAHDIKDVQNALNKVLTQAQVDAELSEIITGNGVVEKIVVVAGKIQVIKSCKPDHADKLRAIDIYNKRFGSNAPTKTDTTIRLGKDLEDEQYVD